MELSDAVKEEIKEYLKNNLTIEVDVGYDWGDRVVKVSLFLDGVPFTASSDTLPTPSINY